MAGPLVTAARDRGVIVITAGKGDIVRLVPPLIVRWVQICWGRGGEEGGGKGGGWEGVQNIKRKKGVKR